jgi:cob(I)alamin adenosyltransferase
LLRAGKLRPAVYRYLNRLSSLFFMLAYRASRRKG